MKPLVSVLVTTYNHEDLISEAIDSVLSQKTKFPYEVVIGDDHSSDKTPKILSRYKKKYPKIIKLLLNKRNVGAKRNFINILKECRGDYIAILDGDDYWINKNKLNIQVEFLKNNPEYAACGTKATVKKDEDIVYKRLRPNMDSDLDRTPEDLLTNNTIPSSWSSVVFRKQAVNIKELTNILKGAFQYDFMVAFYLMQKGKTRYLNTATTVWRLHGKNYYMSKDRKEKLDHWFNAFKHAKKHFIDTASNSSLLRHYKMGLSGLYYECAKEHVVKGNVPKVIETLFLSWYYNPEKLNFNKYLDYFGKSINQGSFVPKL